MKTNILLICSLVLSAVATAMAFFSLALLRDNQRERAFRNNQYHLKADTFGMANTLVEYEDARAEALKAQGYRPLREIATETRAKEAYRIGIFGISRRHSGVITVILSDKPTYFIEPNGIPTIERHPGIPLDYKAADSIRRAVAYSRFWDIVAWGDSTTTADGETWWVEGYLNGHYRRVNQGGMPTDGIVVDLCREIASSVDSNLATRDR